MKTQTILSNTAGPVVAVLFITLALIAGCGSENTSGPTGLSDNQTTIEYLVADPVSVAVGDSTIITARVVEGDETPVPVVGAQVRFGKVGSQSSGSFSADAEVTDDQGVIQAVYYPSELDVGPLDLKVIVSQSVISYVSILVTPESTGPDDPLSLQISSVETSIPADGSSTTELVVTVLREGRPAAGETVTLVAGELFDDKDHNGIYSDADQILNDGQNIGVWDAIGTIDATVTTGSDGLAVATYTAGTTQGSVFIKATIDSVWVDYTINLHGEEAELVLTVAPIEMLADGLSMAQINASILDWQENPIGGKLIRFTAGEPFIDVDEDGYYTLAEDSFTDQNNNGVWDVFGEITSWGITSASGTVNASYRAGRLPAQVTIHASTREQSATITLDLLPLAEVDHYTSSLSPEWIYADEVTSANLQLRLFDVNSTLLCGKEISFVVGEPFTDANGNGSYDSGETITADIIVNGTWDAIGTIESSAISDNIGYVTTMVTAGSVGGTESSPVTVKASAGNWSADIPLDIRPLPDVLSINASTLPANVYLKDAGGQDYATITATCFEDDGGTLVPAGVPVTFTLVSGPGSGEGFGSTGASSITVKTNSNGLANAMFKAGTSGGSVEIEVSSGETDKIVNLSILGTVQSVAAGANPTELNVLGVGANDISVLQATCFLGHQVTAPAGIPVTFSLESGPGGGEKIIDADGVAESFTNADGVAAVSFRTGTISGPVEIKITAGSFSQNLYLGISAGPPAGMTCFADSTSLSNNDYSNVTATVYDAYHNPVPDGVVVVFTANTGLVITEGGTGTAMTSSGIAQAAFQAPPANVTTPELAQITCRVDGSISCTAEISLPTQATEDDPGPIARIELELTANEIAVRETGGLEQCQVIATCYDKDNNLVGRDRPVDFEILSGPNGGESLQEAGWGPITLLTKDDSKAYITLSSGTISGTVRMEARADSVFAAKSALVSIAAGPPQYISVGIGPLNIRGWDVVGATADIIAIVSDIYNNPVREGTVVYFTCDEGIVRGNYEITGQLGSCYTEGGIALGTYFSGSPRDNGRVLITVTTSGGDVTGTGSMLSSGPPATVSFVTPTSPYSIAANSEAKVRMWVEVLDVNDNFVVGGTEISWETNLGSVTDFTDTADGINASLAMNEFTSTVLQEDYSPATPDDGIGGVATVVAGGGVGGTPSGVLLINLLTGPAYRGNCTIEMDSSVPLSSSIPLDVTIQDRLGNPLAGHVLTLTASDGTITSTATTDRYGMAYNLTYLAPADTADVVIIVTDTDSNYGGISLSKIISVP